MKNGFTWQQIPSLLGISFPPMSVLSLSSACWFFISQTFTPPVTWLTGTLFLESVSDFFKRTSSLGNRGARKYLLAGLSMVSIPPFLFPLQPIHQQILLVTHSKYTQNHCLIPLLQQPCCKLPSFLAWTICNKLPLGPCFSTCLATLIHTVYASLPHFLIVLDLQ